jgi:hypothetical protein
LALDLVQVPLNRQAGKVGPPPPKASRGPIQAPVERLGQADGDLRFHAISWAVAPARTATIQGHP